MVALTNSIVDTLVDLIENRLLTISGDGRENSAEYRTLQDCRYALLAIAANAGIPAVSRSAAIPASARASHLRAIPGGKA